MDNDRAIDLFCKTFFILFWEQPCAPGFVKETETSVRDYMAPFVRNEGDDRIDFFFHCLLSAVCCLLSAVCCLVFSFCFCIWIATRRRFLCTYLRTVCMYVHCALLYPLISLRFHLCLLFCHKHKNKNTRTWPILYILSTIRQSSTGSVPALLQDLPHGGSVYAVTEFSRRRRRMKDHTSH